MSVTLESLFAGQQGAIDAMLGKPAPPRPMVERPITGALVATYNGAEGLPSPDALVWEPLGGTK